MQTVTVREPQWCTNYKTKYAEGKKVIKCRGTQHLKKTNVQSWASLVAQLVKNPLAKQETWVQSLGWEDPQEKGKATHSSIMGWRVPWTIVHGVARGRTQLSDFHSLTQCPWLTQSSFFVLYSSVCSDKLMVMYAPLQYDTEQLHHYSLQNLNV